MSTLRKREPRRASLPIEAVAVVIPVQNEESLLPRCLAGLEDALATSRRSRPRIRISVVLVLDSCTDTSRDIAEHSGHHLVSISGHNVGSARRAGVREALSSLAPVDPIRIWVANTDADSVVPANWLTHQLHLADQGADVVIGTVRPDPVDLDSHRLRAWQASHPLGVANGHVHGANLGIRAHAYLAAGGFYPVAAHEDNDLVRRARSLHVRIQATDESWVLTSGRLQGRTDGGYARYLRDDLLRNSLRPWA